MELYLIRHGQLTNNRGDARVPDPPLTDLGKQQADRTGKALGNLGITRLYCSAMLRAVQTAAIVGGHLELPPHVFVRIHEWGGIWKDRVDGGRVQLPGLTRSQLRDACPTAVLPDDVTDEGWCIQAFDAHELASEGTMNKCWAWHTKIAFDSSPTWTTTQENMKRSGQFCTVDPGQCCSVHFLVCYQMKLKIASRTTTPESRKFLELRSIPSCFIKTRPAIY